MVDNRTIRFFRALSFLCVLSIHGVLLVSVEFHDFLRTAYPWAFTKDSLHILCENHFAFNEQFGQLVMTFLMENEQFLGTLILFVDHLQDFIVHNLGRCF